VSPRTTRVTGRELFVQRFALPAAASFFVLAFAHFPMQLTWTIAPAVYLSALCFAWTDVNEAVGGVVLVTADE